MSLDGFDLAAMTVAPPPYLPFLDPHKGKPPGMWALPPEDWIEIDTAYAPQMAYRDAILAAEGRCAADALPDAAEAVAELSEMLLSHLVTRFPDQFAVGAGGVTRADGALIPFDGGVAALGRLVQEDLCLMHRAHGQAEHRLIAGSLCFPLYWRLPDKLGLPLLAIHDPVPGYAADLGARVERLHAALAVERPLQRLNYSMHATPELRLCGPHGARLAASGWWLRTERQTLRRLPRTGAIVFGIKSYVSPMGAMAPKDRAVLADKLEAIPPEMQAYKGGPAFLRSAIAALRGSKEGSLGG